MEPTQSRPLRIEFWDIDDSGRSTHDARSLYAETFWLPVIGPSCMWFLRRAALWLEQSPEGVSVEFADLAKDLGLGSSLANNSPIMRTIRRLIDFKVAIARGPDQIAVRTRLPCLSERQLSRLPEHLKLEHPSIDEDHQHADSPVA